MIDASRITFIFNAKLTFWVIQLFGGCLARNFLRSRFRLGEVYCDFCFAVFAWGLVKNIACDLSGAYISAVPAKGIEPVGSRLGPQLFIIFVKKRDNLGGGHKQPVPNLIIKYFPVYRGI